MEKQLLLVVVLIIKLSGVLSFYIAQVDNQPDVYEIKEDQTTHTLTIKNPKSEKPTLREIIYYHIIEKPYEQVIQQYNNINSNYTGITNNNQNKDNDNGIEHDVKTIAAKEGSTVSKSGSKHINKDITSSYGTTTDNHYKIDNSNYSKINHVKVFVNTDEPTDIDEDTFVAKRHLNATISNITATDVIKNTENKNSGERAHETSSKEHGALKVNKQSSKVFFENVLDTDNSSYIQFSEIERYLNEITKHKNDEIISNVTENINDDNKMIGNQTINEHFIDSENVDIIDVNDVKYVTGNDNTIVNLNDDKRKIMNMLENTDKFKPDRVVPDNQFIIIVADHTPDNEYFDGTTENNQETAYILSHDNTDENIHANDVSDNSDKMYSDDIFTDDTNISEGLNIIGDNNSLIIANSDNITANSHNKQGNNELNTVNDKTFIKNEDISNNTENFTVMDETIDIGKITKDVYMIKDKNVINKNNIIDKNDVIKDLKESNNTPTNMNYQRKNVTKNYNITSTDNEMNNNDYALELEPIIYVYNNYDTNPYDGKEGVDFKFRHFTNGHGFQYFNSNPDNQETAEESDASLSINNDRAVEQILSEDSDIPVNIEKVDDSLSKEATNVNDTIELSTHKDNKSFELDSNEDNVRETIADETKQNKEAIFDDSPAVTDTHDKKRRKRSIITSMAVNEERAPEDMLKDVMDKVSERVKRSVRSGDSYGMTLTGAKGVVWNDLSNEKVSFSVGDNIGNIQIAKNEDSQLLRTRTNENVNTNNVDESYYKNLDSKAFTQDSSIDDSDIERFHVVKTNKGVYTEPIPLTFTKNESEDERGDMKETYIHDRKTESFIQNQSTEKPSIEESISMIPNTEEDYDISVDKANLEEPMISSQTYGMSLIGGRGKVWNDLQKVSYRVGQHSNNLDQDSKISKDDKKIDEKIEAFKNFLSGVPSVVEPRKEQPKFFKLDTVNSSLSDITTKKQIVKTSSTEILNGEQLQMKPKIEKPNLGEPSTTGDFVDEPKYFDKTYGMSLAGDSGIVWNDLNGRRVSYHVGEDKNKALKKSIDDEIINEKISQFQSFLHEPALNREAEIDESRNKTTTETPVTIGPLTEDPIISEPVTDEPKTNRPIVIGPTTERPSSDENIDELSSTEKPAEPIKTFGMSLTGDQGLVWNDLNGGRVSYHVGELLENSEDDEAEKNTTPKPSDDNKGDIDSLLNELDAVINEIDHIIEEMSDEQDKSKNETHKDVQEISKDNEKPDKDISKEVLNEILDIIKDVFAKETAKLEEKKNQLNDSMGNISNKDDADEYSTNKDSNGNVDVQKLVNNEVFRKWLDDWSSSYTDLLINKVDERIKDEVTQQIEEYLATRNANESTNTDSEENDNSDLSKKHKHCDDKKEKKEAPIKISASNIYGNSVENGNVTNIFIFNINKMSDLDNNTLTPLSNGTGGVYVFGNGDKLDEENKNVELEGIKESAGKEPTGNPDETTSILPEEYETKDTTTEEITVKPDEENMVNEVTENSFQTTDAEIQDSKETVNDKEITHEIETVDSGEDVIVYPDEDQKNNSKETIENSEDSTETVFENEKDPNSEENTPDPTENSEESLDKPVNSFENNESVETDLKISDNNTELDKENGENETAETYTEED